MATDWLRIDVASAAAQFRCASPQPIGSPAQGGLQDRRSAFCRSALGRSGSGRAVWGQLRRPFKPSAYSSASIAEFESRRGTRFGQRVCGDLHDSRQWVSAGQRKYPKVTIRRVTFPRTEVVAAPVCRVGARGSSFVAPSFVCLRCKAARGVPVTGQGTTGGLSALPPIDTEPTGRPIPFGELSGRSA
jgi:hypothetical protein